MKVIIDAILSLSSLSSKKTVQLMFITAIMFLGYLVYTEKTERLIAEENFKIEKQAYVSRILLLNSRNDDCNSRYVLSNLDCIERIEENNKMHEGKYKEYERDIKMYKENFDRIYKINIEK